MHKKEAEKTHCKNSYSRAQNAGAATTSWNAESVSGSAPGLGGASSVRTMSFSGALPGASDEGDGERTTEGMRWWRPFGFAWASSVPGANPKGLGLAGVAGSAMVISDGFGFVGGEVGAGTGAAAVGSHGNPGLSTRLTVSPWAMGYSRRSLASARALPLRRRRWAAAGGAAGSAASCALIAAMLSVGSTRSVKDAGGLRLLNVRESEAAGGSSVLDGGGMGCAPEEEPAGSSCVRLGGGGGTAICGGIIYVRKDATWTGACAHREHGDPPERLRGGLLEVVRVRDGLCGEGVEECPGKRPLRLFCHVL